MQQILEDNQIHLNRFKQIPPHASYIAGFIDGDGCIFIRKIKDGYQSGFSITQCRTNVLQVIRYHFGGSITTCTNRNDKIINVLDTDGHYYKYNVRNEYNLLIRNNEYQILLNYLQSSFIIKETQFQYLQEFNKFANLYTYLYQQVSY
jgi:intein/homing endonuclease